MESGELLTVEVTGLVKPFKKANRADGPASK